MKEGRYRKWDTLVKLVTTVLSIIALFVGIWQFSAQQKNITLLEYDLIARKDSIDFRKKLWENKVSVYTAVCTTTGELLSTIDDSILFDKALFDFEKLYYGQTTFVEDTLVEDHLIDFRLACYDYKKGMISPWDLKKEGLALIKACKASAGEELYAEP